MDIGHSVALVTGANRGIGEAFVEALLDAGASRVYAAARDADSLTDLVARDPARIVPLALDITDPAQVQAAAERAADVTLLINNAGTAQFVGFLAAPDLDAARLDMETNYFGTLAMFRAFASVLRANGGGATVTVASIVSHVNFPLAASYSASKAATHSLIQGVRSELKGQGTHVVGVYPGPVDTRMAETLPVEGVPPRQIADAALAAVADGVEDVFPDPMSAEMHANLLQDAKAVERQAAEFS